ncbi:MAG: biopolymer transporter ExbD, partial [Pirellulales bacterium]
HPESAIARQVMSDEALFLGKSLTEFEDLVNRLREATREVEVRLPPASATTLGSRSKIIVINVNRDGSYVVGAQAMKLDQIEILLEKAVQKDPDQKVLVRADGDALYRYVNDAVITARGAGVIETHLLVKQQLQ